MKQPLTDDDAKRLKSFNLFRVDDTFYGPMAGVGAFFLLVSFALPTRGWSRRPSSPPADIYEYLDSWWPYLCFALIFIIPMFVNQAIKRIEIEKGVKDVVEGKVLYQSRFILKRWLIIFWPFKLVVYRRSYHFFGLKSGDKVIMEFTHFRRLMHHKKIDGRKEIEL